MSTETEPLKTAWSIMLEEVARLFDLEKGPLLRVQLLRLAPMQHILVVNIHHIIFDGWSIGQIGLYLNMVVLRDIISISDRFIDLLQRIKQTSLEAFAHQAYPFAQLVQELDIVRDASRNPVFDVGYTWMDAIDSQSNQDTISNLKVTPISLEGEQKTALTDLWFYFEKRADGVEGYLTYNCNLFREQTVDFLKQAFITILEQVLDNPEIEIRAINFLDGEEEIGKTEVTIELNL